MRYIIMCGGDYQMWDSPRQLIKINNEPIVERTIRLLHENGVTDIAISSDNPAFSNLGIPVLVHSNNWVVSKDEKSTGFWVDCFYPDYNPACYLFGDVIYSPAAIRKIVETETDRIEFFASAPPFAPEYIKGHAEPFAFKVTDQVWFRCCIEKVKGLYMRHNFGRHPIGWELWQVIKGTSLNDIDYTNYTVINDYTVDIDSVKDIDRFISKVNITVLDEKWYAEHPHETGFVKSADKVINK